MSRYIVTVQPMDPDVINQLKQMDPGLEIILDGQNVLHQHEYRNYFAEISNFFNEFEIDDYIMMDVIKYDHIDDVMLATMLSDHKFKIIDISDDDLEELASKSDYSRLEKFQDLIHTLDGCRDDAEEATDYDIEGALEKIINVIDNNMDKVKQQLDDMRYTMIHDVKEAWCSHVCELAA